MYIYIYFFFFDKSRAAATRTVVTAWRYQECTTLTMPAFEPLNLTAYNEDLYTFEARELF